MLIVELILQNPSDIKYMRSQFLTRFERWTHKQKQRSDENVYSQQDLLALVDSLRLELRVKESRLRDMEEYMDNLISRVMERNPELLAAPLGPDKNKRTSRFV
ncbi:FIP domain protein [Oesophagostomum dentatum]|uniref:FIP domain protein n=1 Tax=Oesophagostomum dentatum TaxID=61180 RepID=A0A0B1TI48_OESDE|nr:FIP domain protein [Oesophagostomum dentatum]